MRHDVVKRYHPSVTDGNVQRGHQITATSNHQPEDKGVLQYLLSLSSSQTEERSDNRRKRGINHGGTKYLWCTASPPEEHYEASKHIKMIIHAMQTQIYYLVGLAQANAVLTNSNTAVMAQSVEMTVTMNAMQAQLKTLIVDPMNQTSSNRMYYC